MQQNTESQGWRSNIGSYLYRPYVKRFLKKDVRCCMIVLQFVIITIQTLLLVTNVALFNSTLEFFLDMYVFYSMMVIINEMDPCLLNPLDSRDLTAIFCVLSAQIFLLAVSLGLVCYMGLWDSGTKPVDRTPRNSKLSSLMDHGVIHDAFFWILVADLTLQFLWSLYIVLRFFTMLFPDLTRTMVSVPWVPARIRRVRDQD